MISGDLKMKYEARFFVLRAVIYQVDYVFEELSLVLGLPVSSRCFAAQF